MERHRFVTHTDIRKKKILLNNINNIIFWGKMLKGKVFGSNSSSDVNTMKYIMDSLVTLQTIWMRDILQFLSRSLASALVSIQHGLDFTF